MHDAVDFFSEPMSVTRRRFSAARGCIGDISRLAREVPLFPVERMMPLAGLASARRDSDAVGKRIGWAAIFLKAYALVAREMPLLRTWFVRRFPVALFGIGPRFATCSHSVATLAVNRIDDGEDRLFWGRLNRPDCHPLPAIQQFVSDCGTKAVEAMFKRQLQLERTPGVLRRAILRWNMTSASPKRASRIGTFSLSTLAAFGATNRFHPTICTTSLSYAPLESDGRCLVTLIADHRVLDGVYAARALEALEGVLVNQIHDELVDLAALKTTADRSDAA